MDALQERIELLKSKNSLGYVLEDLLKDDMSQKNWIKTDGVVAVDDSNAPFLVPGDCLFIQMAVQDNYNVYYDSRLRQRLDIINDVGLILHETVYRYARGLGHKNSLATRYFVSTLLSKDFANMSSADLAGFVRKLKLVTDF